MIGKIFRVRFCCDNPVGESWYHHMWKLFTPLDETYVVDKVDGELYTIEVDKGYIRGSALSLIHGQVEFQKGHFRAEIWQKLS